ncbi:MAG: UDP-N-acetylenolpyruvoylglucosamine reductase, partial [Patescibacteria group bacterium]
YLIAETKLGGRTHGGAMISPKHPNFIVNTGGASAADVRALMGVVRAAVREKFSVELEPEVFEVGP